ncbi:MAG TPA: polyprenyl diphosphate synthase [Candidatus Saccharimonadales bacterium]|nr:polyprenyl diphosphate synthase [Candidatus Saccharimonadales bacterium]
MDTEQPVIPTHIGFIVDGNRRWAKGHGLPTYEGHLAGHNVLKEILPVLVDRGVKFITFYVFSTENWKRSQDEVGRLMNLAVQVLKDDLKIIANHQARVRVLGTREGLSDKVREAIEEAEEKTKHFKRSTVAFCFNYGGQVEIAQAAQQCANEGVEITPQTIRERLYAPDIPDIDLLVRTSGEQRLSNFMLWRAAYSEFLFMDKNWPDITPADIDTIINEYAKRQRRFGGN